MKLIQNKKKNALNFYSNYQILMLKTLIKYKTNLNISQKKKQMEFSFIYVPFKNCL